MKTVAILQPNYIPWKGVFDLINRVDTFVFFDDVQYTKKDWRNRNRVKTQSGLKWLSVPVANGSRSTLIKDVVIDQDSNWREKHFKTWALEYKKAPFFEDFKFLLDEIYHGVNWRSLCEMNIFTTKLIASVLDSKTDWVRSSDLEVFGDKSGERVVKICKLLGCDSFINGPASKKFMDENYFAAQGIKLEYMKYEYPEYGQIHGEFVHGVSVLDVFFNCGASAPQYIFT